MRKGTFESLVDKGKKIAAPLLFASALNACAALPKRQVDSAPQKSAYSIPKDVIETSQGVMECIKKRGVLSKNGQYYSLEFDNPQTGEHHRGDFFVQQEFVDSGLILRKITSSTEKGNTSIIGMTNPDKPKAENHNYIIPFCKPEGGVGYSHVSDNSSLVGNAKRDFLSEEMAVFRKFCQGNLD